VSIDAVSSSPRAGSEISNFKSQIPAEPATAAPLLTVVHAWRMLCRRTGGQVSRTTFYRWINEGRLNAVRLGYRFMIPLAEIERVIQLSLDGERL